MEFQLLQLHLVEPTLPGSVSEKFQLHITSSCLLELLVSEYLRETNISIFISHLLFSVLQMLRKILRRRKKQEKRWKQSRYYNKLVTVERDQDDEILTFDLAFVAQNNTIAITACFQKVHFQGFNLVILKFELPSAFLYALCELFEKQAVLFGNNSVLVKIRHSLLCETNHCMKVTSKLFLPSISRFKFFPP